MIEVGKNSRFNIHWKVSPFDFSKESMNYIIASASKKYSIPKSRIRVTPEFQTKTEEGKEISLTSDIVSNIQNPEYQREMFKDYLKLNKIEDYNFDFIKQIDSIINDKIDYKAYDNKHRRFSIKWIKWDNFLSYGVDNVFDFTSLRGLVLLEGDNQSGKTTFAIDLIHFLLFGKTPKVQTQDKIFNKHRKEATKVDVEGCIKVDGEEYIIKRVLTRPTYERRTVKSKTNQKVEFYRIIEGEKVELEDYVEELQEENTSKTNKKIKEAIGREDDFDLVMSITESNLDSLIEKKDSERGRLFSRWIGLLPLEEKDSIAREYYNKSVKPYYYSNNYNSLTVKDEIGAYNVSIKKNNDDNAKYQLKIKELEKEIEQINNTIKVLVQSKQTIDENVLKIDISTLNNRISATTEVGKQKKSILEETINKINEYGDIEFSVEEYEKVNDKYNLLTAEKSTYAEKYKSTKSLIENLKKAEYCPTCGRKLDNVDNSSKISELSNELEEIVNKGKEIKQSIDELSKYKDSLKELQSKYDDKNKLTMKKQVLELNLEKLRGELKDLMQKKNDYNKNSEAIDKNNNLDIQIRNYEAILNDRRIVRDNNLSYISQNKSKIEDFNERIKERQELLKRLDEEAMEMKNWKIYLDMVGKNGISKMVLRKTLPIINARLAQILSDVCDFDVKVSISDKNEILFSIIKDGVESDLSSGSGFERTCSSLALRFVLAEFSSISKLDFVLVDEVLGRVAKDNLENIHKLFDKILNSYSFILHVCHLDEAKEWSTTQVYVKKTDNISKITVNKAELAI